MFELIKIRFHMRTLLFRIVAMYIFMYLYKTPQSYTSYRCIYHLFTKPRMERIKESYSVDRMPKRIKYNCQEALCSMHGGERLKAQGIWKTKNYIFFIYVWVLKCNKYCLKIFYAVPSHWIFELTYTQTQHTTNRNIIQIGVGRG